MNIVDAIASFFAAIFNVPQARPTEPSGATVPVQTDIYDLRPVPGPLTNDAPANFPAQLSYLTWNVLGADVGGTPNYPTTVSGGGTSTAPDWRRRAQDFLTDLFGRPTTPPTTPPITPPVTPDQSPPGWFDVVIGAEPKPIQSFTDQSPPGWFDIVIDPSLPKSQQPTPPPTRRRRGIFDEPLEDNSRVVINSFAQSASKDLTPKPTIIVQPPPAP